MEPELAQLETQLESLINLYARLKSENVELRTAMRRLEADNKALADKVKLALSRIESLIERLPEE